MKKVLVLLFSFTFLMLVLPTKASNIDVISNGIEFAPSFDNEDAINTNNGVISLNEVVINVQPTNYNAIIPKVNLDATTQISQEVEFVDTGYLVGYVASSNTAIFEDKNSGVNFKGYGIGDVNKFIDSFMSASDYMNKAS